MDVKSFSAERFPLSCLAFTQYVFLGATSTFKADSDLAKYEKARKLKDLIVGIRKNYETVSLIISVETYIFFQMKALSRLCIPL